MAPTHRGTESDDDSAGLPQLEVTLRRALATTESSEARYHVRSALQYLEVLRAEPGDETDPPRQPAEGR